jgi:adenylate cyclase
VPFRPEYLRLPFGNATSRLKKNLSFSKLDTAALRLLRLLQKREEVRVAREQRKLAAILAADVVGYSRLMGRDESGTPARLRKNRAERLDPVLTKYGGRVVKLIGDGALVEFGSAVDALSAAIEWQQAMAEANGDQHADDALVFRIGLHLGDLIVDGDDLYGDGVNVAARLEAQAPPAGILISRAVHEAVTGRLKATFTDLGSLVLKNIERPVQAFQVRWDTADWKPSLLMTTAPTIGTDPTNVGMPSLLDKPSVAILPFANMSGDPEQEYFADGITEDIITALSKWRWFFVIARNSTFTYKGRSVDVRDVSRELGVRYVLTGSVRRAASRVRITAQLIDASSAVHVWAEQYDRQLNDVFDIQDEVTQSVAAAIGPALADVEGSLARRKRPEDMRAWDHCLRGSWAFNQFSRAGADEAVACFRRAIEQDPDLADGYVGLARALFSRVAYGFTDDRSRTIRESAEAAKHALTLDSQDFQACYILALIAAHDGNPEAGISYAQRAIDLNPNFSGGYFAFAVSGLFSGRPREALSAIDVALKLSPRDPQKFAWLGQRASALFLNGHYAEAVDAARQSLALRWYPTSCRVLAAGLAQLGDETAARVVMAELLASPSGEKSIAQVIRPFQREADRDHYAVGLRKAGMPAS